MSEAHGDLTVAFGESRVAVRSNDPVILSSLASTFRQMRGKGDAAPIATLSLRLESGRYRCARAGAAQVVRPSSRGAIRWARQQILEAIIGSRPDLLWLHGAVAGWKGRAIILPGKRGRGKSTLVTALCARGATFLTDDILPLDPASLHVHPFPRVPEIRHDPGREMPADWLLEVPKTEIALDDRIERSPLPVGAIILPRAGRSGGVSLEPATPAEAILEIAEGCWNFEAHGANAVATLSRLVSGSPIMRLSFDSGRGAADTLLEWIAAP